jgi:hypothetical protein
MITVIPMPVFPYPAWDLGLRADVRAADADRDVAADILCAAVADGRLTLAELDERLEHVLSARTIREIARLISDLPRPSLSGPVAPAVRRAARPRPPVGSRWSLLQSLLAPARPN